MLSLTCLSSGCIYSRSIEVLGMITVLGIDKGEREHHLVTVGMPIFQKEAAENVIRLSAEGSSVVNALEEISQNTELDLVTGQIRTVVIGEELAKEGVAKHLDLVTRDSDFPLNAAITVCKGKANEFLQYKPKEDPRMGIYLRELLDSAEKRGLIMDADITTFYIKKNAEGWDPCLPFLEITEEGVTFVGRALFRHDKMVGFLSMEENKIETVLDEQAIVTPISFEDPFGKDEEGNKRAKVNIQVNSAQTKVKTSLENGQVKALIKVSIIAEIIDNESNIDLLDPQIINVYNASFAEQFSRRAESILAKTQELRTDPLGVGAYFRMQNYKIWEALGGDETWRDYWMTAEVKVETEFNLRRFGATIK